MARVLLYGEKILRQIIQWQSLDNFAPLFETVVSPSLNLSGPSLDRVISRGISLSVCLLEPVPIAQAVIKESLVWVPSAHCSLRVLDKGGTRDIAL